MELSVALNWVFSFAKVDILLQATLESAWREEKSSVHADLRTRIVVAHKNWKRYKVVSKQFLVPVSTFLTIVKKYRKFQTAENPERRGRKQKLSSRNVWKILWDQIQPKFEDNITFSLIKIFKSTLQRTMRKKDSQVADQETHLFYRICK